MKIWIFHNYSMLPEHGQLTRAYSFGKYLESEGHQPVVFVGSHPHNTQLQLIDGKERFRVYRETPFPWVLVKTCSYGKSKIKRVFSMFEYYFNAKKAAKNFDKPDAILGSSAHPLAALLAVRLGKKYRCKSIVEIRDLWPESIVAYGLMKKNNPIIKFLYIFEKYLYTEADAVVFTMEGGKDYIVEQKWDKGNGGPIDLSKVFHINNGVDLETFQYDKINNQVSDVDLENSDIFKVVYTGSIRRANNIDVLLDTAKLIKNNKVRFLIWGTGDELQRLQKRVLDERIENVVFKGFVEKKYIPFIVSKADLNFFHVDNTELLRYGLSLNKMFEYMAAGKPVMMDCVTKYNPVIQCGAGVITDDQNPETIARCIDAFSHISRDEYKNFCEKASIGAEKYDFKVLTKRLVEIAQ